MADQPLWGTHQSMLWKEWFLYPSWIGLKQATEHTVGELFWWAGNAKNKWEDLHRDLCFIGINRVGGAHDAYQSIWMPRDEDFKEHDNLSMPYVIGARMSISVRELINSTATKFTGKLTFLQEPKVINWNRVTGQLVDGVQDWSAYAPDVYAEYRTLAIPGFTTDPVQIADLPGEYHSYLNSVSSGGNVLFNPWDPPFDTNVADFFRNGWMLEMVSATGMAAGQAVYFTIIPISTKMYYLNGAVNSISHRTMKTTGGINLILRGLGFRIPEADIEDYAYNAGTVNFDHRTYSVEFLGVEGQGDYSVDWNLGLPARDYDMSNTEINIFSMPPMAKGTYRIRLKQVDNEHGAANFYYTYVGSWRAREDGRAVPGDEFLFVVTDDPIPKKPPVFYFKWGWKYGDLKIWERYAPIDVRATETFWEGRVGSVSGLRRAIDDKSGLFSASDADVTLLQGSEKHFSKLLSQYTCKGQVAEISHGWGQEPEGWHSKTFYGVVEDYSLKGPVFNAKLKDLSSLYFNGQLPRFIITNEEFPHAEEDSIGRGIPEILGEHSLTTGTAPGAIEAIKIWDAQRLYIMAGGPLHSITAVYSEGVLVNPALYTIIVEPDGRQYIQFTNDQGDNKITFNCTGYFFGPWNSANGYIQNPAYIIAFIWAMLMEIPVDFIDWDTLDELADLFEDMGWDESGRVALTALEAKDEVLKKILYSFGINFWQTRDGYFRIGRKDISNLEPAKYLFAQIDIFDYPDRKYNLQDLVNSIKARSNYFPAPEVWENAIERNDLSSINWFGATFSVEDPWDFYWNSDSDFVDQRIHEELIKLAYGYKKAEITVPMDYIDELDIFDNVRVQDPFAPSADGSGDSGRYYYIIGIDYEWESQSLRLELIDLHWLLQQYFIFGDEDVMPDLWTNAGDYYRLYGYLCDENTWEFSDGFPGKILIDENLISED